MEPEGEYLLKNKRNMFWKILANTGHGAFHYKLNALCGFALTSDAIEVLSVANILPGASCDLNLNDAKKGWINSSVFIGMCVGSLIWGCLGDVNGRKFSLIISLFVNGLFNLLSSFSQSFEAFIIFRLLSGVGVGGSMPVLFTYISEFLSKENRGISIGFISMFWAVGGILASGAAWLIIPTNISWIESEHFRYRSWQWYLLLCSIPALVSSFLFLFMPETPKFLYENNKIEEAKVVLRLMYNTNKSKYDLKSFEDDLRELGDEKKHDYRDRNSIAKKNKFCFYLRQIIPFLRNMIRQLGLLFARDIRCMTISLLIIYNAMSFGYYGMIMWFPELFKRMEMYNGSICIEGNVSIYNNGNSSDVVVCGTSQKIYLENLIVMASSVPGCILVLFIINKFGRRLILSASLITSGISVFLIYFLKDSLQGFIFSCIFIFLSSLFWNVSNMIMTEVFPSNLRSTGSGLCLSVCRFASILINLLMGYLLHANCIIPIAMTSIFLLIAAILTWLLKETKDLDLK